MDFRGLTSIYVDIPALRPGTVGSYVFAVLCTLAAVTLRLAIDPHVVGAEYIVFFPAVTAATLVSGVRAGLASTALSFAAVIFFFLPPRLNFWVEDPAKYPALALFILIMVSEVLVAAGMRLALERYHELSRHLEERVEARTAEALLHSRQCEVANQRLQQINDELMAVYDQGLYAAHLDMDGNVFRATRACVEGCGFVPSEIMGKPFWECGWWNDPETQAWVRNGFERAASGMPFRGEAIYVFKNGTEHIVEMAFIPIRAGDRVAFVFVPGTDVTERVHQYQATFDHAAVGIARLNSDLKWRQVNKTVTRTTGYSAAELATKTIPEITHPDDLNVILAQIELMRAGEAAGCDIDMRYVRKDGTTTWVRAVASCVRTSDGSIDHFILVAHDISARKRDEELLRRQAELLDQSHDAIFTWKIGGGITYWNRGAEKMYGYTAEDARERDPHELLQTRSDVPMPVIESQICGSGSWHGELTHTTRDGSKLVVESSHVRVFYDDQMHALETNRDITARKHAEEQARLMMREMNHRAKNMLTLVQAIANQTAAHDPERFIERFAERLRALAANQDLLVRNEWRGVNLEELVRTQLAHFADCLDSRIVLRGPRLQLNAAAQAIGLALHELATNSSKHGALSTGDGHVGVDWQIDRGNFAMNWTERGGPPVKPPERRGFGTTVIDSMARRSINGEVELAYDPSGLAWRLSCPVDNALEATASESRAAVSG